MQTSMFITKKPLRRSASMSPFRVTATFAACAFIATVAQISAPMSFAKESTLVDNNSQQRADALQRAVSKAALAGVKEASQLAAKGGRLELSSLRGLRSDHYLARRRPEPNVAFEAAHRGFPAALLFGALQELVRTSLGDGGDVHTFTRPDDVSARFSLSEKEKGKLAKAEHVALVEGLLTALGASEHPLAPLWLLGLDVEDNLGWRATRWTAYGASLRSLEVRSQLQQPLLPLVTASLDGKMPLLVREAAVAALGSVPSVDALHALVALIEDEGRDVGSMQNIAVVAIGLLGDARLARRLNRVALSERAFSALLNIALGGKKNVDDDVMVTGLVGCAPNLPMLTQAAQQLRQASKTSLAAKLEQHIRVRARRQR